MLNQDQLFEKKLIVYINDDNFIIKSKQKNKAFIINKITKKAEKLKSTEKVLAKATAIEIIGTIGIIESDSTSYLLLIKSALFIGCILNSDIFKVDQVIFLPFIRKITTEILPEDLKYISMYKDFLTRNSLYFSETYDLTNSIKGFYKKITSINTFSFQEVINNKFCWNYNLLKNLDICREFLFPVICGYVNITTCSEYSKDFNYTIISRRDTKRAGIRFQKRGSDINGNTDNFYETEQIITFIEKNKFEVLSYYMIRGSIPLLWSQSPNLTFNPNIKINSNFTSQVSTFRKHLTILNDDYNKTIFINLINKKNFERFICSLFEEVVKEINKDKDENIVDLLNLDFNEIFKDMKQGNIYKMINNEYLKNTCDDFSITHLIVPLNFMFSEYNNFDLSKEITLKAMQDIVYRFNCIDCIDRTNITQYYFSIEFIHFIINKYIDVNTIKLLKNNLNNIKCLNANFDKLFKYFWIQNGDQIAFSYCGTPTFTSSLIDSNLIKRKFLIEYKLKRFYLSNFCDGYHQDCLDYSLGLINSKNTNLTDHSKFTLALLILVTLISIVILYKIVISFSFPVDYVDNIRKRILRFILFICISSLTIKLFITHNRERLIDKPSREFDQTSTSDSN